MKDIGDSGTKINTSPTLKTTCPELACIWENMQGGKGLITTFVCDLFKSFEDPNDWKNVIDIRAGNLSTDDKKIFGKTDIQDGIVYIEIDKSNCGGQDKLEMFETLQHELIHAKIFNDCMNLFGFDGKTQNSLNYLNVFKKLVVSEYGTNTTTDQHKLMLDKYINDMVINLIEITKQGTYDDYIGLVLNGFPEDILWQCGYSPNYAVDKFHNYNVYKHNNSDIFNKLNTVCP